MRVYAATIPFLAVLVAIGYDTLFAAWGSQSSVAIAPDHIHVPRGFKARFVPLLGISLAIFVVCGGPLVAWAMSPPANLSPTAADIAVNGTLIPLNTCPEGQHQLSISFDSGSWIHLIDNDSQADSKIPHLRVAYFRARMGPEFPILYPEYAEALLNLPPETIMTIALSNFSPGGRVWLFADIGIFAESNNTPHGPAIICGELSPTATQGRGFFYAKSLLN
jgi:hypothetical protein